MKDSQSDFLTKYATAHPDNMPDVAGIFANARIMLNSLTEKDVAREMKTNGVSAELGALNILQNYAMAEIEAVSMRDMLLGGDSGAYSLYMAINEEKLEKGYIDIEQYNENKRLGFCLRTGHRLIF